MSASAELLKLADVKRLLNCSLAHAYALVESGQLKHIRIGLRRQGGIRVRLSDLEAFIAFREEGGEKKEAVPTQPIKLRHLHLD